MQNAKESQLKILSDSHTHSEKKEIKTFIFDGLMYAFTRMNANEMYGKKEQAKEKGGGRREEGKEVKEGRW